MTTNSNDRILTPAQVARMYGVDPKTIGRWAKTYDLPHITTPGGHRRYRESDIHSLIGDRPATETESTATPDPSALPLAPSAVARMFGVNVKTVVRWANAGKIRTFRTPGGVRRFDPTEIAALLNGETPEAGSR